MSATEHNIAHEMIDDQFTGVIEACTTKNMTLPNKLQHNAPPPNAKQLSHSNEPEPSYLLATINEGVGRYRNLSIAISLSFLQFTAATPRTCQ